MRVIIAGSRNALPSDVYNAIYNSGFKIDVVISGDARGADTHGARWAEKNGIPVEHFPAMWDEEGKYAGYKRNTRMAEVADALIAAWDGVSKGTKHMIETARKKGLRVFVYTYEEKK